MNEVIVAVNHFPHNTCSMETLAEQMVTLPADEVLDVIAAWATEYASNERNDGLVRQNVDRIAFWANFASERIVTGGAQ